MGQPMSWYQLLPPKKDARETARIGMAVRPDVRDARGRSTNIEKRRLFSASGASTLSYRRDTDLATRRSARL